MNSWDPSHLPRGEGHVRCTVQPPVAEIRLCNPARRNAVSPGMMADLAAAVEAISGRDDLSVVLIRGEGNAFCSGGDLKAVRAHLLQEGAGAGMCAFMTAVLDALAGLPLVRIGAVVGPAIGGGAELLSVCDVVYASPGARIGFVQAALGISPGWGGGRRLVTRVGRRHALRVLTEARRLSADEAQALGLVDVVAEDALAAATAHCDRLAAMPAAAVRAAVEIASGEDEAVRFTALWGGPDHVAMLKRVKAGR